MPMTRPTSEQVTFLASGSGAVQRTALDKFRETVSVKDFGAVGDGVADDSVAIQAAVNAVIAGGGGTVLFPRGKYRVTATISTPSSTAAIHLLGEAILFTSTGTVIDWRGGNNTRVFDMPAYGCISNMFVVNGNSATGVTAVSYAGASAGNNRARGAVSRLYVQGFEVGFLVDWAWNINFTECAALYCTTGYSFRNEANACTLTGCSTNFCGTGISDANGSGARGVVWIGGSIENSTVTGISVTGPAISNSWQFHGTYFESNYRAATLGTHVALIEPFFNADGGAGAREPIVISGSRGIRIENAYTTNGITSLVDFTGSDSSYTGNSVYIGSDYLRTVPQSLYDHPDSFRKGWLESTCYEIIETGWLGASGAQLVPISLIGESAKLRGRSLIGAQLVVRTQIVVSGTATFGIGRSGPGFDEIAAETFNANIAVGVHNLTMVNSAPAVWFPETFAYFASGTAETSGSYKIVAYFA